MTHIAASRSLFVLVVAPSEATAQAVREALGQARDIRCEARTMGLDAAARTEVPAGVDVIVAEADPDDDAGVAALGRFLSGAGQGVPVVVTAREASLRGVRRLMQLGVVDVVPQPIQAPDLLGAIRAAAARRPPRSADGGDGSRPRGGTTVAVLKGGGGVGATTIAVHLAHALARRADEPGTVGLVDLDVQFGACGTFLDLESDVSSMDLLQAGRRLDGDMLKTACVRHRSGLDVLPAPPHILPLDGVAPESAARLVEVAARTWAQAVVDLPMPWTPWTRAVLENASCILLVLQLTVPGVRQAARQLETLTAEGLGATPVIGVVNRSAKGLFGRPEMVRQAEKTLGLDLNLFVPSDWKAVSAAIDAGATLFETHDFRAARKAVEAVAKAVLAVGEAERRTVGA